MRKSIVAKIKPYSMVEHIRFRYLSTTKHIYLKVSTWYNTECGGTYNSMIFITEVGISDCIGIPWYLMVLPSRTTFQIRNNFHILKSRQLVIHFDK